MIASVGPTTVLSLKRSDAGSSMDGARAIGRWARRRRKGPRAAAAVSRPRPPSRTEMQGITPKTRLSIRINSEFGCKIETKQIVLLETIQAQGSISRAAQFLGLSYRGTQKLIEVINKGLREPAVSTVSGGRKGGGAALTPIGIQLVELYRMIEARAQAVSLPEREALHSLIRSKKIFAD